jgi:cell division protein FtsB
LNQWRAVIYHQPVVRLSNCLRREWPSLILGAILAALVGNALLGANGPRDLLLLRQRRAQLEVTRAGLIARQTELETTVQNLRSNDRYLEHLIRRELGYARPDELIYKFTGQPGAINP